MSEDAIGQPGEAAAPHSMDIGLLVIPGIYIGIRLVLSTQALVVEGRRGTQAMGRSWALVGGHWWHAFGTLVVAGLLSGIVNAVITTPFNSRSWADLQASGT